MKTAEVNTSLIEGYLELLEKLSPSNKLELISKLSALVKIDAIKNQSSFKRAFGALESDKTAEEIIQEIKTNRDILKELQELN